LHVELLSDSTFSRGEGTAGVVDTEVEHDHLGLPFIGGKTLRGLLRDSWLSMCHSFAALNPAAERILGRSRSLDETCRLRIGDARLPDSMRHTVRTAVERSERPLSRDTILAACTSIRHQTAESRETGAPMRTTLRSSRVVLRGFEFQSSLTWLDGYEPDSYDLRVLALSALATRHGGMLRNRGRGHIRITLDADLVRTQQCAKGTP
jgi:hypothetical protein